MILWVLIFLGCILVFNLLTYSIYFYERGKHPEWDRRFYHISWSAVRGYLIESLCTLVLIILVVSDWVWSAVRRWLRKERKTRAPLGPGDRPVILCHGYHMRGLSLGILAMWLRWMGRSVIAMPTFGPTTAGVRHYADQLSGRIRDLLQETGADAVDLVGHSMGGLVARACLAQARRDGDSSLRVAHLVTLGTPHRGTDLWAFTWGDCGLDMRPGSSFFGWLGEDPADVDATVIYSSFDAFVREETASGWNADSVDTLRLDGIGHVALSMLPRAAREVFEAIRD